MQVVDIDGKRIIVRGIGRMYFESGLPIGIAAQEAEQMGYVVSWLHVADDLQKNGMDSAAIIAKLSEEAKLSNLSNPPDMDAVAAFVSLPYEEQRTMIFEYLFGSKEVAMQWARNNIYA